MTVIRLMAVMIALAALACGGCAALIDPFAAVFGTLAGFGLSVALGTWQDAGCARHRSERW